MGEEVDWAAIENSRFPEVAKAGEPMPTLSTSAGKKTCCRFSQGLLNRPAQVSDDGK